MEGVELLVQLRRRAGGPGGSGSGDPSHSPGASQPLPTNASSGATMVVDQPTTASNSSSGSSNNNSTTTNNNNNNNSTSTSTSNNNMAQLQLQHQQAQQQFLLFQQQQAQMQHAAAEAAKNQAQTIAMAVYSRTLDEAKSQGVSDDQAAAQAQKRAQHEFQSHYLSLFQQQQAELAKQHQVVAQIVTQAQHLPQPYAQPHNTPYPDQHYAFGYSGPSQHPVAPPQYLAQAYAGSESHGASGQPLTQQTQSNNPGTDRPPAQGQPTKPRGPKPAAPTAATTTTTPKRSKPDAGAPAKRGLVQAKSTAKGAAKKKTPGSRTVKPKDSGSSGTTSETPKKMNAIGSKPKPGLKGAGGKGKATTTKAKTTITKAKAKAKAQGAAAKGSGTKSTNGGKAPKKRKANDKALTKALAASEKKLRKPGKIAPAATSGGEGAKKGKKPRKRKPQHVGGKTVATLEKKKAEKNGGPNAVPDLMSIFRSDKVKNVLRAPISVENIANVVKNSSVTAQQMRSPRHVSRHQFSLFSVEALQSRKAVWNKMLHHNREKDDQCAYVTESFPDSDDQLFAPLSHCMRGSLNSASSDPAAPPTYPDLGRIDQRLCTTTLPEGVDVRDASEVVRLVHSQLASPNVATGLHLVQQFMPIDWIAVAPAVKAFRQWRLAEEFGPSSPVVAEAVRGDNETWSPANCAAVFYQLQERYAAIQQFYDTATMRHREARLAALALAQSQGAVAGPISTQPHVAPPDQLAAMKARALAKAQAQSEARELERTGSQVFQ